MRGERRAGGLRRSTDAIWWDHKQQDAVQVGLPSFFFSPLSEYIVRLAATFDD